MQRVMITGATGTIGVALIKELIKYNIEVLVLTRASSHRNSNIPIHPLVTCKNCALEELDTLENETGKEYDVIFHLAWAGASGSGRNDMYMQCSNIKYALDALAVGKRFGCKRYIGVGSQAEYGRSNVKLNADTPTFPENGYGYAKLCAGQMTRDYANQLGMEHIWVRVLSIYGPCDGENSMIMSTINQLQNGISPRLTKGEQEWDYLYSEDAARALRMLAERGKNTKTYVLGSGTTRRLSEYAEEIRKIVNPDIEILFGAVAYGAKQVMYLCADIDDLKKDVGFQPEITYEEGIRQTIQWCREHPRIEQTGYGI